MAVMGAGMVSVHSFLPRWWNACSLQSTAPTYNCGSVRTRPAMRVPHSMRVDMSVLSFTAYTTPSRHATVMRWSTCVSHTGGVWGWGWGGMWTSVRCATNGAYLQQAQHRDVGGCGGQFNGELDRCAGGVQHQQHARLRAHNQGRHLGNEVEGGGQGGWVLQTCGAVPRPPHCHCFLTSLSPSRSRLMVSMHVTTVCCTNGLPRTVARNSSRSCKAARRWAVHP